jgi:hypothetical protein
MMSAESDGAQPQQRRPVAWVAEAPEDGAEGLDKLDSLLGLTQQEKEEKTRRRGLRGAALKESIVEYYAIHNPSKLAEVDAVITQYEGREDVLADIVANAQKETNTSLSDIPVARELSMPGKIAGAQVEISPKKFAGGELYHSYSMTVQSLNSQDCKRQQFIDFYRCVRVSPRSANAT